MRGTLHFGIHIDPGPITLSTFLDADLVGDPSDRKSTTGILVFLGSSPISWSSKKQSIVMRSSTAAELAWLRTLF